MVTEELREQNGTANCNQQPLMSNRVKHKCMHASVKVI